MKKSLLLIFLISTLSAYAEINPDELRPWGAMEFTYKTGGVAPQCIDRFNAGESMIYDLALPLKDDPDNTAVIAEMQKYLAATPIAASYLMLSTYTFSDEKLHEMLSLSNNYPVLTEQIISYFYFADNLSSIENYEDYICELKYRNGCLDMSKFPDKDVVCRKRLDKLR